jgi:hypothetical protein
MRNVEEQRCLRDPAEASEDRRIGGLRIVLGVVLLFLGGCGYSHKELYPADVRTIAVPIFANRSFYQGAEFDLTEALTKEIETRTPYKVVKEASADSSLTGTIVNIEQTRLSRVRGGGVPQEMEFRVTVNFEWKNLRSGKILRERRGFTAVGRYVPTRPVNETYFTAQHDASQLMAEMIVSDMRGDW